MRRVFVLAVLISCSLILSEQETYACSCYGPPSPCEAFGNAKAVFVGEVIEGKSPERMSDLITMGGGDRPFVFHVKEAFLGSEKDKEITIVTGSGFGDCGFPFQKGERYLVYAYEWDGKLETNVCTRTRLISKVDKEDFEFLKGLSQKQPGSRIEGKVELYAKSSLEENYMQPMKKLKIQVEQTDGSRKKFQAVTDEKGNYILAGLPTGKYKIAPILPKGLEVDSYETEEFLLNDKGCANKDFTVENDSLVFVKVIDAEGNPVKNILVELVPVNVRDKPDSFRWVEEFGVTNPEGGLYNFNVPPGRYTISINYVYPPNGDTSFPTTFYPNVSDRSKATVIEVGLGTRIENLVIQLPARLKEKSITGSIVWADGTPAVGAEVFLIDNENHGLCINGCGIQDSTGIFTVRGYFGRRYKIKARAKKTVDGKEKKFFAESNLFTVDEGMQFFKLTLEPTKKDTR